jgi:hypothetical protein
VISPRGGAAGAPDPLYGRPVRSGWATTSMRHAVLRTSAVVPALPALTRPPAGSPGAPPTRPLGGLILSARTAASLCSASRA